jgi:hypothetical protein
MVEGKALVAAQVFLQRQEIILVGVLEQIIIQERVVVEQVLQDRHPQVEHVALVEQEL